MPLSVLSAFAIIARLGARGCVCLLGLASVVCAANPNAERTFALPAGDAAATLKHFVEQSGEQVLYLVHKVEGVRTNAVDGRFTARAALGRLLANTPLMVLEDEVTGALMVSRINAAHPAKPNTRRTRQAGGF